MSCISYTISEIWSRPSEHCGHFEGGGSRAAAGRPPCMNTTPGHDTNKRRQRSGDKKRNVVMRQSLARRGQTCGVRNALQRMGRRIPPPRGPSAPPCVTFRRVVAPLRGPGQSPVLPFACCVGSLLSVGRCGQCSCPPPPPPPRVLCHGSARGGSHQQHRRRMRSSGQ